jgi:hypothetical protein
MLVAALGGGHARSTRRKCPIAQREAKRVDSGRLAATAGTASASFVV